MLLRFDVFGILRAIVKTKTSYFVMHRGRFKPNVRVLKLMETSEILNRTRITPSVPG